MYIREYMHTDVITVSGDTLLSDAQKLMAKHKIRRLPVVDKDKRLVGLLTEDRIRETTKHPGMHVNIFEFLVLLSKLKVKDVMVTEVVTVTPDTTVEEAVAIGQRYQVGTLPVVEGDQLVGITTTTDLYRITVQALGFGKPGVRLHIFGTGTRPIGEITNIIASKGIGIRSLFHLTQTASGRDDCIIHLDTKDATAIANELKSRGYGVEVRPSISPAYAESALV
jgi:acetoin utilization protein AcuB